VVDVLGGGDARLDQVIGFMQDRVLKAVDEEADDGLLEHTGPCGSPERVRDAVHFGAGGRKPCHHFDDRRGIGRMK